MFTRGMPVMLSPEITPLYGAGGEKGVKYGVIIPYKGIKKHYRKCFKVVRFGILGREHIVIYLAGLGVCFPDVRNS